MGVADADATRAARDVVANDLGVFLARFGPKMVMPVLPERLISLERILVPVESMIAMPTKVLSVMSLETILVPVESPTTTPSQLPMRSLPAIVVLLLSSTSIASWSSGMLLTTLFTILVLRELPATRSLRRWFQGCL